jgi:carbamoyltransferase
MQRVVGLWDGHDCSFCVLEDGRPTMHVELERHNRVKHTPGDSVKELHTHYGIPQDVLATATCFSSQDPTIKSINYLQNCGPLYKIGHHQAHAAHAFFSSNFEQALVVTLDGGGIENHEKFTASISAWLGKDTKLHHVKYVPASTVNIGAVWSRVTRYIFRYESGWPQGDQAGTVMALAALGDPKKYYDDFYSFLTDKFQFVNPRPEGHVVGMSARDPRSPKHSYLHHWESIAQSDPREMYDMAAALQLATENLVFQVIAKLFEHVGNIEYLCLAGGVALNSVMTGKLMARFPHLKGIYIPPVPYDGGLSLGAAQFVWHNVYGRDRIDWGDGMSPYLGKQYTEAEVHDALIGKSVNVTPASDDDVIQHLLLGKIVSIYNGRAESGRRALGNRSIIADPRNASIKDIVNHKVKHRQWFRPFAPSVIEEEVPRLFNVATPSPYMGFVLEFKDEVKGALPAIVHFDGTARLQTVTPKINPWYHAFIKKWGEVSGYGILLNTSFNDSEPIVERPDHAVNCFLRTEIDYLYFPEYKILVSKS